MDRYVHVMTSFGSSLDFTLIGTGLVFAYWSLGRFPHPHDSWLTTSKIKLKPSLLVLPSLKSRRLLALLLPSLSCNSHTLSHQSCVSVTMLSQTLWPLMRHTSRGKVLVEEWILGGSGHDGRESVRNAFESYLTKLTSLLLIKGLFSGRWYFKLFNLIIFLGGTAMACMGKHFHCARYLAYPEIRD